MTPHRAPRDITRAGRRWYVIPGYLIWRVATTLAVILAAGALLLSAVLYSRNRDVIESNEAAIKTNHDLVCVFTDLVQLAPTEEPHGSIAHLQAELNFLLTIHAADCDELKARPQASQAIDNSIDDLEAELERRRRAGQ